MAGVEEGKRGAVAFGVEGRGCKSEVGHCYLGILMWVVRRGSWLGGGDCEVHGMGASLNGAEGWHWSGDGGDGVEV